jgi:UPF0755 protein
MAVAEPESEPVNLAMEPVADRRFSEMQERASRFGVASRPPPELKTERVRVVDASEGTKIDPLLNRTWDLNSAQTIPAFR